MYGGCFFFGEGGRETVLSCACNHPLSIKRVDAIVYGIIVNFALSHNYRG